MRQTGSFMSNVFWSCCHGSVPMTGATMHGTSACTFSTLSNCPPYILKLISNWLPSNVRNATSMATSVVTKQSQSPSIRIPRLTDVLTAQVWWGRRNVCLKQHKHWHQSLPSLFLFGRFLIIGRTCELPMENFWTTHSALDPHHCHPQM